MIAPTHAWIRPFIFKSFSVKPFDLPTNRIKALKKIHCSNFTRAIFVSHIVLETQVLVR